MGWVDKLKAATTGEGGAQITNIELERFTYRWGDVIRGTATLEGGTVDQRIDKLVAKLTRHHVYRHQTKYHSTLRDDYKDFSQTVFAADIVAHEGFSKTFPFEVKVPDLASPSGKTHEGLPLDWAVVVEVHVHRAKDHAWKADVEIRCPRSLEGLVLAVEEVAPVKLSLRHNISGLGVNQPTVYFLLLPDEEGKELLDGVTLKIREEDGQVVGTLDINPQEHSLKDHLRSLVRLDHVVHQVRFPAALLSDTRLSSENDEVKTQLREWFRPHLTA